MNKKEALLNAYKEELERNNKDQGIAERILEQLSKQKYIDKRHIKYNPILQTACTRVGIKNAEELKEILT